MMELIRKVSIRDNQDDQNERVKHTIRAAPSKLRQRCSTRKKMSCLGVTTALSAMAAYFESLEFGDTTLGLEDSLYKKVSRLADSLLDGL